MNILIWNKVQVEYIRYLSAPHDYTPTVLPPAGEWFPYHRVIMVIMEIQLCCVYVLIYNNQMANSFLSLKPDAIFSWLVKTIVNVVIEEMR